MTKQVFEIEEQLLNTTKSLDNLWDKLYEKELAGEKDSEEFKTYLGYVQMVLEAEKEYYSKMSMQRCETLLNYLVTQKMPFNHKSTLEIIISQEKSDRVIRRIMRKLEDILSQDSDYLADHALKQITKQYNIPTHMVLEMIPQRHVEELTNVFNEALQMNNVFQEDAVNTFLSFVEEAIGNRNNRKYLPELLKVKYDVGFTHEFVENDLLKNNFDIQKQLVLYSKFKSDMLGIDELAYKILKTQYGIDITRYQIPELLETGDLDYREKSKAVSSILRQAILRSGFLLVEDELIHDINQLYHDFIDNPEFIQKGKQTTISQAMIIEAFNKIKKDRNKHRTLISIGMNLNP